MRKTCSAKNCRPVRLLWPSSASRAATARSDRPQVRSSRARAIVACSLRFVTSRTPSACSVKPKGTEPTRSPRARLAERRVGPRANQAVLVLRGTVDYGADEHALLPSLGALALRVEDVP